MWSRFVILAGAFGAVLVVACQASPPPAITPTSAPLPIATPGPTQPLRIAFAVGSPTPAPALAGDYTTLVQARLETMQRALKRLDQQLSIAQKAPMRMSDDEWLNQTRTVLEDLLASSADFRSLGTLVSTRQIALAAEVYKVANDVDFVANEYRMAFDYDPDASHFLRAVRAEKSTAAELDSLAKELERGAGAARQGILTR